MNQARAFLTDMLGLLDPMEASEAELEALERDGAKPRKKQRAKRIGVKSAPRDELGRFTRLRKK